MKPDGPESRRGNFVAGDRESCQGVLGGKLGCVRPRLEKLHSVELERGYDLATQYIWHGQETRLACSIGHLLDELRDAAATRRVETFVEGRAGGSQSSTPRTPSCHRLPRPPFSIQQLHHSTARGPDLGSARGRIQGFPEKHGTVSKRVKEGAVF